MDEFSSKLIEVILFLGGALVALISFIGVRLHNKSDEAEKAFTSLNTNVVLMKDKSDQTHEKVDKIQGSIVEIERGLRGELSQLDRRQATLEERTKWLAENIQTECLIKK